MLYLIYFVLNTQLHYPITLHRISRPLGLRNVDASKSPYLSLLAYNPSMRLYMWSGNMVCAPDRDVYAFSGHLFEPCCFSILVAPLVCFLMLFILSAAMDGHTRKAVRFLKMITTLVECMPLQDITCTRTGHVY